MYSVPRPLPTHSVGLSHPPPSAVMHQPCTCSQTSEFPHPPPLACSISNPISPEPRQPRETEKLPDCGFLSDWLNTSLSWILQPASQAPPVGQPAHSHRNGRRARWMPWATACLTSNVLSLLARSLHFLGWAWRTNEISATQSLDCRLSLHPPHELMDEGMEE